MSNCTVSYGPLRFDWDGHQTVTIARTDIAGSVQLSVSEWAFLLKLSEIVGWPTYPPIPEQIGPT